MTTDNTGNVPTPSHVVSPDITDSFPENTYMAQGLDQLVAYCVSRILAGNEECTFERLVFECFTLFPAKFSFGRYPQWPDSARINKSWLRCRTDKKWIIGSVKAGFAMTPAGKKVAELVAKDLGMPRPKKTAHETAARERWGAILSHIKRHPAYRSFTGQAPHVALTEDDVRDVLITTDDTPRRVIEDNLAYFRQVADAYKDADVLRFLEACASVLGAQDAARTDEEM